MHILRSLELVRAGLGIWAENSLVINSVASVSTFRFYEVT
jgi:hypothetical protein